ncbi:hypothetical protein DPMN_125847 [Dreissena polymorpha]|uniref:Uncharacterized protein n=1 Tax=Dreissena polymorpha TaxID=45954 RepID=A0A9D4GV36_DREPO|nr:hypothetical protein DPMN_125847 [Dreissena polymorpha]
MERHWSRSQHQLPFSDKGDQHVRKRTRSKQSINKYPYWVNATSDCSKECRWRRWHSGCPQNQVAAL